MLKRLAILPIALLVSACGLISDLIPKPITYLPEPADPIGLSAAPGPGYIRLAWQSYNSFSDTLVIYRDPGRTGAAEEKLAELPASAAEYLDRDIEVGVEYRYRVAGKNEQGEAAGAQVMAQMEPGVTLSVGTYNLQPLSSPQTAFAMYFTVPAAELPSQALTVTITGPEGWNDGQPHRLEVAPDAVAFGWTWAPHFTPAVTGNYRMSASIGGQTYAAAAQLATTLPLPYPDMVTVTSWGAERISATWSAVPGAKSYHALIYSAPPRLDAAPVSAQLVTGTSVTLGYHGLPPGDYVAGVRAYPNDRTAAGVPALTEQFHVSLNISETFGIVR
jgi:hypothetical protein